MRITLSLINQHRARQSSMHLLCFRSLVLLGLIRNRPFEPASSKGLFLLTLRVLAIALAVHCGSDVGVAQLRTVFPETSMRRDKPLFAQAMYRTITVFKLICSFLASACLVSEQPSGPQAATKPSRRSWEFVNFPFFPLEARLPSD